MIAAETKINCARGVKVKPAHTNIISSFLPFIIPQARAQSDPICRCSWVNVWCLDLQNCQLRETNIFRSACANAQHESIPRSLDELTAPAKLRFIIRRMRYSRAAPSEYFPVMLNEIPAKTQICSLCMQFESPLQILTGSAAFSVMFDRCNIQYAWCL